LEAYSKKAKMKVILLENPDQHRSEVSQEPRSIYCHIESWVRVGGGKSELVKSLREAESRLSQGGVDWVVIPHYDFKDVDKLRESYPQIKYAAASAALLEERMRRPGSIAEDYWKRMQAHYDFLLPDFDESILKMLKTSVAREKPNYTRTPNGLIMENRGDIRIVTEE